MAVRLSARRVDGVIRVKALALPCSEIHRDAQVTPVTLALDTGSALTSFGNGALRGLSGLRSTGLARFSDGRTGPEARATVHLLFPDAADLITVSASILLSGIPDRREQGLLGLDLIRQMDLKGDAVNFILAGSDAEAAEAAMTGPDGRLRQALARLEARLFAPCRCEEALRKQLQAGAFARYR